MCTHSAPITHHPSVSLARRRDGWQKVAQVHGALQQLPPVGFEALLAPDVARLAQVQPQAEKEHGRPRNVAKLRHPG